MERRILTANEAKGIWHYSIIHKDKLFRQKVYQPIDSKDFYTYVIYVSLEDIEGHRIEVLHAISELEEGPFATIDQAVERGNDLIRLWEQNNESPST